MGPAQLSTPREREIGRTEGREHGDRARRSNSGEGRGQRQREGGFQLSDSKLALMFQGYHEINEIGKSTCQNLCFFSFFFFFSLLACRTRRSRVGAVSEPHRSRVGAVSENREKKKKKDTAGHRNPARRTRSGVRHVSNTDTTPKMACPCNLVSNVWVEILCHAQQLGRGGELLTHVWLLMAHLGITEQFQISKGMQGLS